MSGSFDGNFNFLGGSGVFEIVNKVNVAQALDTSVHNAHHGIDFKASRGNALYGASSTVQTASLRAYALIRYA